MRENEGRKNNTCFAIYEEGAFSFESGEYFYKNGFTITKLSDLIEPESGENSIHNSIGMLSEEGIEEAMKLIYDQEVEAWVRKPEPYTVIEVATEEDYKTLQDAIDLKGKLKELGKYNFENDVRGFLAWVGAVNNLIEQYTATPSKRESEEENNG